MAYDFFGQNKRKASHLLRSDIPALADGRAEMARANTWLGQPGAQGADAVAADQFSQIAPQAAQHSAGGPMAAQAASRDVAAAYGGGARAGGMHAAQEYGQRMDTALGNYQNLYDSDVAEYRTAAEAYNEMQRLNRQRDANNANRSNAGFGKIFASVPIVGDALFD